MELITAEKAKEIVQESKKPKELEVYLSEINDQILHSASGGDTKCLYIIDTLNGDYKIFNSVKYAIASSLEVKGFGCGIHEEEWCIYFNISW
jgi:hypothetical protein